MEGKAKVKLLVYATAEERQRIKMAAAKLNMSMSQLILDSVMEQVSSIEALDRKTSYKKSRGKSEKMKGTMWNN